MSDLLNKDNTNLGVTNGKLTSITNVSNVVLIDTKSLDSYEEPYIASDFYNDGKPATDFLVISKGETFKFFISVEKETYFLDSYTHFDKNFRYLKISVRKGDVYTPITNFDHDVDTNLKLLQRLIKFDVYEHEKNSSIYKISLEFEPFDILEYFDKNYTFDVDDLKIEIADKSGHIFTCTNKIPIYCFPFDLDSLRKLEITFEQQNPSDRYIGDNSIGSVVAIIHNPDNDGETCSADFLKIDSYLSDTSVGRIIKREVTYFYYNEYGERVYVRDPKEILDIREKSNFKDIHPYEWLSVKIDGILHTGYVQIFANLLFTSSYSSQVTSEAAKNYIEKRIYNSTVSYATDGEWLTECPNNKKINLEPFVPMYLKESQYFDFVKFTENFLNTMFYSNDTNCKVGILKKIEDLRTLHNIDELDRIFFNDFAKHFGSTIKIDERNLVDILTIFGDKNKKTYDEEDLTKYIREAYRILPYYNRIKGTDESIKLILSTFGCSCEIIYKWLSKLEGEDELFENIEDKIDKDKYYLSSHFNIDLGIKNYRIEEYVDIIQPIRELVFSIKPITRVFDAFEYTLHNNENIEIDLTNSILNVIKVGNEDDDIYEHYLDDNGDDIIDISCNIHIKSYTSNDGGVSIYEIDFKDYMTKVGLDNLEKFVSNNGMSLSVVLNNGSFLTFECKKMSFINGKLYLICDGGESVDDDGAIKCKCLRNSLTYIN